MQTAYDQIFQAIEAGYLKPNDRLFETELATRFGVSRTRVRKAIRRLEAEGIVTHLLRIGAEIRTLESLNGEMAERVSDPIEIAILNRRFHCCIMQAGRNHFMSQSYHGLLHALILLGKIILETGERVAIVFAQHKDIIAALKTADPDAAAEAIRVHMEASLDHGLKALHIAL